MKQTDDTIFTSFSPFLSSMSDRTYIDKTKQPTANRVAEENGDAAVIPS